jgi:hypothetical protein
MKKVWEVLVHFENEKSDVRCRSDVDTHSLKGFKRLENGDIEHNLVGTNFVRTFKVVYTSNNKRDADHFAETMRMAYSYRNVDRSIMRQEFLKINS